MIGLLLLALLAFNDGFNCSIRGDLYLMPGDVPELVRTDGCQALVQHRIQDGALHLSSDVHWVVIALPARVEHQQFLYHWGARRAFLHNKELTQVADGWTAGG